MSHLFGLGVACWLREGACAGMCCCVLVSASEVDGPARDATWIVDALVVGVVFDVCESGDVSVDEGG